MNGLIFLLDGQGKLAKLREEPYPTEELLQKFLADYPELLPGDQIDPVTPRRWLLVSRELGVPGERDGADRWALDHLFVDQDAVPTLVEVKRSSDSRIRREVVGQMLDYAANAVAYLPVEGLVARFEAACEARGADPAIELYNALGQADGPEFWRQVGLNLSAGRVRLVFVADVIPPELQRAIEFLNGQMNPAEVLAVEIKQFVGEGVRTLVPRVIGLTAAAEAKKQPAGRATRTWDEMSFFDTLTKNRGADEAAAARAIYNWAKDNELKVFWGKGNTVGGFIPKLIDVADQPATALEVWTTGQVEILFNYMLATRPFDEEALRTEFLNRLNTLPGDKISGRPYIPLSTFRSKETLWEFLAILDWWIDRVTMASPPSTRRPVDR